MSELQAKIENKLTQKKEGNTFQALLNTMMPEISKALPKHITAERMCRIAHTAYSSNKKLQECDPRSIIAAVMTSSQLGLEINTPMGEAYIIPYGKVAQFQVGYKGLLSLAYRSGQFKIITAVAVDKNDVFEYELGLAMTIKHKPSNTPSGKITHYYAVYKTVNGGEGFAVMSHEQVEAHAIKYSQAVQKGWTSPWKTDFDAMAKKTVLKEVLKYAPKSIEFARQMSNDETARKDIMEDMSEAPVVNLDEYVEAPQQEEKEVLAETKEAPKAEVRAETKVSGTMGRIIEG